MEHPANWYPDPEARHELRYWDGSRWTEHVSDAGMQSTDPLVRPAAPSDGLDRLDSLGTVGDEGRRETIDKQLRTAGVEAQPAAGSGSVFDEPVLIVNQKAKVFELNNQYSVFDANGKQIAAVNQVGQSKLKKAVRLVSSLDQYMTHRLQVTDASGAVLLDLTRPRKIIKSTVIVGDGRGAEIGRIVQQNAIGKIRFGLESGGALLGSIKGENWRAWNFRIEDASGNEVARITKTWEGVAKTLFTTADNYVVHISRRMPEPLNSLIVASALSVDTALKQDARGLG